MSNDFNTFCEDFLLKCAEIQTSDNIQTVNTVAFCNEHFPAVAPTFKTSVGQWLSDAGFGSFYSFVEGGGSFMINGNGLSEVARIRDRRRPKTRIAKIKSVTRSDWIAIGVLVVSLAALFYD